MLRAAVLLLLGAAGYAAAQTAVSQILIGPGQTARVVCATSVAPGQGQPTRVTTTPVTTERASYVDVLCSTR